MTLSAPSIARQEAAEPTSRTERRAKVVAVLRRPPRLAIGGELVILLVLIAIFAPLVTPYNPIVGDVSDSLEPPSAAHWLGTDDQGRDVLTRVLPGARLSLSL